MKERVIFHCDANSFFASVEIAHNPSLKGMPVAVSGNPKTRTGIILTKNEVAKKYGVETGETIWMAKQKCPNLVCLAPHYDVYEEYSRQLRNIYERYTDKVECFGIDECWLDVTETVKFFGGKEAMANKIREEVKYRLGISISVGVSFGKLFAKLGSDLKKPDAVTIIGKENFKSLIYPLKITSIIGIGRRLNIRFNKIGVFKLGDIITIPDHILKKKFGIIGLNLKQKLLGYDMDEVKQFDDITPPKSVGNGTTTVSDIYSRPEVLDVVTKLCEEVSTRLRKQNFSANNISVTLKTANFKYFHDTLRMPFATNSCSDLKASCMQIIDSFWEYNFPLRAIRVCSYNLTNSNQCQLNMFDNFSQNSILDLTIDKIRKKYGYFAITPASSIKH